MSGQILAFAAAGASIPLSRNRQPAERIAIAVGTAIAVYLLTAQEEAPPKRRLPWRPKATPAAFPGGSPGGVVVSCVTAEGEPCDLQPGGGGGGEGGLGGEGEGGLGGEGEGGLEGEGEGGLGGEGEGEGEGQGLEGDGGENQGGEDQGEGEGESGLELCNLGAYEAAKHDAWRQAALALWKNRANAAYSTGAAAPWDKYDGPADFETWWRWAISATAAASGIPVPSQVCTIPDDWEGAYLEIASILSGSEDEPEEA